MAALQKNTTSGMTLTELLVVVVIIGILSTIAVPVYINQSERAKRESARMEVRQIGQAMEQCGMIHGLYVPLQTLDDLPGSYSDSGMGSDADAIKDSGNVYAIDFNLPISQMSSTPSYNISTGSSSARVRAMVNDWGGPFLNPQRVYDTNDDAYDRNKVDLPLDPWGNPYRFYSPIGLVGNNVSNSTTFNEAQFNGILTTTDDHFDRWAIVSWGPDGESDNQSGTQYEDDIFYLFGFVRSETTTNP